MRLDRDLFARPARKLSIAQPSHRLKCRQGLGAARDRLTGTFRDSYSQLIDDVVIPAPNRDTSPPWQLCPRLRRCQLVPTMAVALIFVNRTHCRRHGLAY